MVQVILFTFGVSIGVWLPHVADALRLRNAYEKAPRTR